MTGVGSAGRVPAGLLAPRGRVVGGGGTVGGLVGQEPGTVGALVGGLVAGLALGMDLRREVTRTGAPLARTADDLARSIDPARTGQARAALTQTGADARLIGPAGRTRIQTGGTPGVWDAGAAAWPDRSSSFR